MLRQITLVVAGLLLLGTLQAQDPVFSQFYAAPLQLNPAFAGSTYAPRISLNYRNQWMMLDERGYQTYAASYEQSIESLNSGFGITLMADDAASGTYKTNYANVVYGYKLRIQDDWFVKFGVEAGLIQTAVDWDKLVFGDQIDPIFGFRDQGGNPIISQEQRPENLNNTVFDIGAGLLVYNRSFYAGLSVKHLNTPDQSLLQINQNLNAGLPMRVTLHTGVEITLEEGNNSTPTSFISPNIMVIRQGDFGQINAGAYLSFGKFFGGLWYRHAWSNPDAGIGLVGFKQGILRIGYSYDFTISSLQSSPAGGTGGTHEVSLTINLDDSKSLQRKRRKARYQDCFKMFN
jgi:type IX secretion system PorP/SprF family membrane protein